MKKKIIFAVATGLFALATVFNMNMLQSNNAGDVSLDAITVMAQAQSELPDVTITCSSGPDGRCYMDGPDEHIWTPFGPMCQTTCVFSGYQSDFCVAGMPC